MSSKVVSGRVAEVSSLALDFPSPMGPMPPPPPMALRARRDSHQNTPMISRNGRKFAIRVSQPPWLGAVASMLTPLSSSRWVSSRVSSATGATVVKASPFSRSPSMRPSGPMVTWATLPASTASTNSV